MVDDDLALAILPAGQRALVRAMRWPPLRRLMMSAGERAVPRFVGADRLPQALHRRQARRCVGRTRMPSSFSARAWTPGLTASLVASDIPVFEVDLAGQHQPQARSCGTRDRRAACRQFAWCPSISRRDDLVGRADRAWLPHRHADVLHLGRRHAVPVRGRGAGDARRVAVRTVGEPTGVHLRPPGLHRRRATCTARPCCTSDFGNVSRCGASA